MNRKGFSLIELSIVMGVIAILTMAIVPRMIGAIEIKAGEKTIAEVNLIQTAVQRFYKKHNQWPDNLEVLQQEGYLSQYWSLKNPWGNAYELRTYPETPALKYVSTNALPEDLIAKMVKSRLPGSFADQQNPLIVISPITPWSSDAIPSGVIVAWSGTDQDVPVGWGLCDGKPHGEHNTITPNLTNKFIIGANQYDYHAIYGGMSDIMKPKDPLPSGGSATHLHGELYEENGIKYGTTEPHKLKKEEMPTHQHASWGEAFSEIARWGISSDGNGHVGSHDSDWDNYYYLTSPEGGDQAHTHYIKSASNVPPFFALAFIMKL